ncbi:MAG: HlyD family efflux transporter periplasmic adaptor subunit [Candidatus Paceibacterota bacterium]|jgi:multidrug efflux pump subunit AcrA (membrane-fusion protein)
MSLLSYLKGHAVLATTIIVVAVAGATIAGRVVGQKAPPTATNNDIRQVSLVDVANFRSDSSTVVADGIVESVSQADLKSQLSGPLSVVNVAIGDYVYAGQVIAQIQNADIRAQLAQAETSLSLEDVSVESARRSAVDSIRDSYQKGDEVVRTQLDQFVLNTAVTGPKLANYVTDTKLYNNILTTRVDLVTILRDWKKSVDALTENSSDSSIQSGIELSEKNVEIIRGLLDNVSVGINTAASISVSTDLATLNSWKVIVSGAKASIGQVEANLTAADRSFRSAITTHGSGSGAPTSVAASGVQNLQVQLARTIFTSPISGTVAALPLRVGELVTPGQLVATIVGVGGLEINAFASGDDISRLVKGAKATIQNKVSGTVVNVSPIVNPANKKSQVKISVDDSENSGLVVGQNVSVSIRASTGITTNGTTTVGAIYRLPIQNVKIVPGDAYVFTLDGESKTVRNAVTLGKVEGDFVEISAGLTPEMKIISPVYEIEEGQTVNAK